MLIARTGAGPEPTRPGFESGSAAAIWTDGSGEMAGAGARDGPVSWCVRRMLQVELLMARKTIQL